MIDGVPQPHVCGMAHDDDVRFATALGNRRDAGQCPEPLIITSAEGPGSFGEQCGEVDPTNSGQGPEDCHVALVITFVQLQPCLANGDTEFIEPVLSISQLAIYNTQTDDQRSDVDRRRFGNPIRHFDSRLA